MRSVQRMKPILDRLKASWATVPDLRLGQLLINATTFADKDLFNIEDEELAKIVKQFTEASK